MCDLIVTSDLHITLTIIIYHYYYHRCEFDPRQRGYDCKCDTVRGFVGDGYTSSPEGTCFENPAICDPNADCIPTRDHQSKCR